MRKRVASFVMAIGLSWTSGALAQQGKGLWSVYDRSLKGAKYIDLTHVIAPNIPVWHGFGPSKFEPAEAATRHRRICPEGRRLYVREAWRRGDPL